jgi:glycosyltransferase involved in cell wall biosynthesis
MFDPGFGRKVQWDIPLLAGYRSILIPNRSRQPGLARFFGLLNPAIIAELRQERYDAVLMHGYNYATHWLAFLAARFTGTALWLRGESTLSAPRPLSVQMAKQATLRPLFRTAQACLYIGSLNRQFYEYYGVDTDRLFFAPYSVDDSFFRYQSQLPGSNRGALRQRLGIATDMPVILVAGKLSAKKQPLHLLRAFERLRARRQCALIFAGDGELRVAIQTTCADRSIPDVYITGFLNQTEMPAAYSASDVLVLPSAWGETWGLAINEGMNCSLPVVVTDRVGCASDLVRDGENGYVVSWNDVNALVDALEKLIADPELRKRFGCRSFEIIQDYSLERTVEGVVRACQGTRRH